MEAGWAGGAGHSHCAPFTQHMGNLLSSRTNHGPFHPAQAWDQSGPRKAYGRSEGQRKLCDTVA